MFLKPSNAALAAQRTHTIMSTIGPSLPQAPGAAVSGFTSSLLLQMLSGVLVNGPGSSTRRSI
jgi:hypothetical protein